jgi:hypothetical protein
MWHRIGDGRRRFVHIWTSQLGGSNRKFGAHLIGGLYLGLWRKVESESCRGGEPNQNLAIVMRQTPVLREGVWTIS